MKKIWFLPALALGACGQSGAAQEPHEDGADAWARYSLAASGVSAEMPCSTDELRSDLFPVDEQLACLQHGGVFGLMRDPRAIGEIERAAAANERFTVERASLPEGARTLSITRIGVAERHLVIALQNGDSVVAVYRETPRAGHEGDQVSVDRFFNSIEVTAK